MTIEEWVESRHPYDRFLQDNLEEIIKKAISMLDRKPLRDPELNTCVRNTLCGKIDYIFTNKGNPIPPMMYVDDLIYKAERRLINEKYGKHATKMMQYFMKKLLKGVKGSMIDIKADEEKFNYRNRAKEVTVELLNRFDGPDDANENAEEIAKFLSYIVHELSTYNVNVPVVIRYQKSTALYNKERDEVIFQKSSGGGSVQKTREVPRRKKHLFTKKW